MFFFVFTESQSHRSIEHFELEGTHKDDWVQFMALHRINRSPISYYANIKY